MILRAWAGEKAFKRAVVASAVAHSLLLALVVLNPRLPRSTPKGVIRYIPMNLYGGGDGGGRPGGGLAAVKPAAKPAAKKETLRDLTTAQKLEAKPQSDLRYPTDKPKRDRKVPAEKKAAISKPDPDARAAVGGTEGSEGAAGGGGGSGLTIGTGEGFGEGAGGGGLGGFPYAYYLQQIQDRIQANWFPSIVDTGEGGLLQTHVYFRILRNGSISAVEVKASSGVRGFDLNAVRAVTNGAPFPPLPADYDPEFLGINLLFEHAK